MSLEEEIKSIQKGDFRTGWAWWNRVKTNRIQSLSDVVATKSLLASNIIALEGHNRAAVTAKLNTQRAKEDFQLEIKLKIAVAELQITQSEIETKLIKKAAERGLTLVTFEQIIAFEANEKIRVSSHLQIAKGESQIRKSEKGEDHILQLIAYDTKANIDVEKDRRIKANEVEAIVAIQLLANTKMNQAQDHILNLIKKRDEIQQNQNLLPESKQEALDIVNESIRKAKEAYNYGENRLLQINSGQKLGGFDEDSDL